MTHNRLSGRPLRLLRHAAPVLLFLGLLSRADAAFSVDDRVDFVRGTPAPAATTELEPHPEPSVIDLAIFYDMAHADRRTSLKDLDVVAERMVAFMNAGLARNGVPLTMRIVYAGEFDRTIAGLGTREVHSLLGDRVRALRTSLLVPYGADAVVLIRATDDADELFGVATLGHESAFSDPEYVPHALVCFGAAPTSGLECFGRGGIFAHEVGHTLGAGHQVGGPGGSAGAYNFSHASDCGGGTLVFSPVSSGEIYSTPDISIDGTPCGVDASAGPDGADNAHTIDLLREPMARLRATMPVDGEARIIDPLLLSLREGDAPVSIAVRRDGDLTNEARVFLQVIEPASAGGDLLIQPEELVFTPGLDTVTAELRVVDDGVQEPAETFEIGLRNPFRLSRDAATLQVSVADNDTAPPPPPAPPPRSSGGGNAPWTGLLAALAMLLVRKKGLRGRQGLEAGITTRPV